jgi:integrase
MFVFPGPGRTGHLTDIKKPWQEFRKRAGLENFRIHDLRHTHASYQSIAGVSLQQIGKSLGHRSLQSTQIYAELHDEAVRGARESGQAKMLELMTAARKRAKTTRKPRLLAATNG